MVFRHKNIRLPPENYVGQAWHFLTLCCANRRKRLEDPATCQWLLSTLCRHCAKYEFRVHAYCVMPDHLHILAEGLNAASDLLGFVRAFKHDTSFSFRKESGAVLWQKKFYDHILRSRSSPDDVAWYIWMNPVRAGLCSKPEEFLFSGSFTGAWPISAKPSVSWLPPWKM